MLKIVEQYLQGLGTARTEPDIERFIGDVVRGFGFRSAYMVEYSGSLSGVRHIVDTSPARRSWWPDFLASDLRPRPADLAAVLAEGPLVVFDASRFGPGDSRLRRVCEAHDLIDITAIPVSYEGELVGVLGFCGAVSLNREQRMGLTLIGYNAFAQLRATRASAPVTGEVTLTPREREVIGLSAEGMTSIEIAGRLGISPRTANQHVDNVADKLGTRNRAHTVAESVRRGLL